MALHGKIEVNGVAIGQWEAVNKGAGFHTDQYLYQCAVEVNNTTYEFELFHFREDGAATLASKVLWQYALRVEQKREADRMAAEQEEQ